MADQKPVQKVDDRTPDEKALGRLVVTQYVFAGMVGLWTLFSAILFGMFLLAPYQSAAMVGSTTLMAVVSLLSGVALTVANINSARAIAARADAHVSFFVAGVNAMLFPFGTLVAVYSWRVLTRESVRAIYAANSEFEPARIPHRSAKAKLVEAPVEEINLDHELPRIEDAEEEMWRKLEEEHQQRDRGKASSEEDEAGPVRLVPGND